MTCGGDRLLRRTLFGGKHRLQARACELVGGGGTEAAGWDIADIDGNLDFGCIGSRTKRVDSCENVSRGVAPQGAQGSIA